MSWGVGAAVLAAIIAGALAIGFSYGDKHANAAWQGKWDARNSQEAQTAAAATAAVLEKERVANANNQEIRSALDDKTKEADGLRRDRDLANRLLTAAAAAAAGSGAVSKAGGGPGLPSASAAQSVGRLGELVADAITECRLNAGQLNALSAEVTPQL